MIEGAKFTLPVYKNQGTLASPTNVGVLAAAGDSIILVVRNDNGTQTTRTVTITAVGNANREIFWDSSTTDNLRTEDVVRVAAQHQYNCPGPVNWAVVLTESGGGTAAKAKVTSFTFGGVVYAIGTEETAIAAGIEAGFNTALVNAVNALLGPLGFASGVIAGVAGTQTLTLTISGMQLRPSASVVVGLTAGAWTAV